ncbi:hypothetical protein [Amycolatopsis azurea]|uniref:hypothetical protein n=1 Tax=Amycolatopsis azurea TaxID=36819 RepID=UPI001FD78D01|nr:hypothetical protein [Amycolatopsis azurea]
MAADAFNVIGVREFRTGIFRNTLTSFAERESMRPYVKVAALAGATLTVALLPVTAAQAAPAPASGSDPIITCESGYHGWMRRAGKDAICLKPGTRTWDVKVFECAGDLTVHFKNGEKAYCGGNMKIGLDLAVQSTVVKTVVGNR